ncbi:hypothetical protein V8E36_006006 [Tilletia maclaganii]
MSQADTFDSQVHSTEDTLLNRRSRFASSSCWPHEGLAGSSGTASQSIASTSKITLDHFKNPAPPSASKSSSSSRTSGSGLASTSSHGREAVRSAKGDKKRSFDEGSLDFELISIRPSKRKAKTAAISARRSTPAPRTAVTAASTAEYEEERDELISDDEPLAHGPRSSINGVQTGAEDADDELGNSDWSDSFRMPKRSSNKRWTLKEQTLFMHKLRAETRDIKERLSVEERTAFFIRFEARHGKLFNSRSAKALASRLSSLRTTARMEGKELPRELDCLLPPK